MSLRPRAARWFELLTAREDAAPALEVLARTGSIELEKRPQDDRLLNLDDMRALVERFHNLQRRYHDYWPQPANRPGPRAGSPYRTLTRVLALIRRWEQEAAPLIVRLESLTTSRRDLALFEEMLHVAGDDRLDYARIVDPGGILQARLFVLAPGSQVEAVVPAGRLLVNRYRGPQYTFLLAVGEAAELDRFGQLLAAIKGRILPLPAFISGNAAAARDQVERQIEALDQQAEQVRRQLDSLNRQYRLPRLLGEMQRLGWFLRHVDSLPVSHSFAWITGWTSDLDGDRLKRVLNDAGVRALIHFPSPPATANAPMLLRNPRWGRPFEAFVSMLGAPGAGESDPSSLLALLVPLLFGYMFGDVGQGLVLVLAGLWLQRRWPLLEILVRNGIAAMVFGFVFGSVFGNESLLPALWVHPLEAPLEVLKVPLVGAVIVLSGGLVLRALQYAWIGQARLWWLTEAPQMLLYLGVLAMLVLPGAWPLAAAALLWYLYGSLVARRLAPGPGIGAAVGTLVENLVQLLINTLSFVRVGAFALAHAGLALAFATLAQMPESVWLSLLILVLGNLAIIVLEGLVVTIQSTRLVLFEFFVRFLRAEGRVFRPLAAPPPQAGLGSRS